MLRLLAILTALIFLTPIQVVLAQSTPRERAKNILQNPKFQKNLTPDGGIGGGGGGGGTYNGGGPTIGGSGVTAQTAYWSN